MKGKLVEIYERLPSDKKIIREPGYLYFVGRDGYTWAAPTKHNKAGKKKRVGKEKHVKKRIVIYDPTSVISRGK